jgi:hypothetical protein
MDVRGHSRGWGGGGDGSGRAARVLRWAGLLVGSALALAACSGSDSDGGGAENTASTEDPLYYTQMFPKYNSGTTKFKVAIVGGGASGLTAAWHLRRLGHHVTVLEKNTELGGNVKTQPLNLGGVASNPYNPDGKRWADLGVNDFNTKTYRYITYMLDRLGVVHLPLQDTAMFGDNAGKWFIAGSLTSSQTWTCSSAFSQQDCNDIRDGMKRFFTEAIEVVDDISFKDTTVDEYVYNVVQNKGNAPYPVAFINNNLKPRISNMYFTNLTDPGTMPIRYVMSYYTLQEGLNGDPSPAADRRYWRDGASTWLNVLRDTQLTAATPNPPLPDLPAGAVIGNPVEIRTSSLVQRFWTNQAGTNPIKIQWVENGVSKTEQRWDKILVATDPRGVIDLFNTTCGTTWDPTSGLPPPTTCPTGYVDNAMFAAMMKIHFNQSKSVVHKWDYAATQDNNYANVAAQRTYNIFIYPGYVNTTITSPPATPVRPYTISYVENSHQNDATSPYYGRVGVNVGIQWPTFYTTLERDFGPYSRSIPDAQKVESWNNTTHAPGPVVQWTSHHIISDSSLADSQQTILGNHYDKPGVQGQKGVYIGSGWIRFAGLHEELFVHTMQVAAQIDDPANFYDEHIYNADPSAERHAPLYIAQLLVPKCLFSGSYFGVAGQPPPGVNQCIERFDFPVSVNPPPPAGGTSSTSYVVDTCSNYTGQPYFTVSGDVTNVTYPNPACQLQFTPTKDGTGTLCAGIKNQGVDTEWDFKVKPTITGTSSTVNYDASANYSAGGTKLVFPTIKGTQYTITPLPASWTAVRNVLGTCMPDPNNYPLDWADIGYSCTANQDGYTTICLSNFSTYTTPPTPTANATFQVEAVGCSSPQATDVELPYVGSTGGGECTAPERQCPAGWVATGVTFEYFGWARRAWLQCREVINGTTLGGTELAAGPTCGGSGPSTATLRCYDGTGEPAVVIGQRVYVSTYTKAVAPICRGLTTGTVWEMTPPNAVGTLSTAQCPSNTQVYSMNFRTGSELDGLQMVCGDLISMNVPYRGGSCQGLCGGYNSTANCYCDDLCALSANNDCCQDFELVCSPKVAVIEAEADTYVVADAPTSNYGTSQQLIIDTSWERTLLRFNLSSIPAGASIRDARLQTYAHCGYAWGGDGSVYTHFVPNDTWAETGVTWNTQPPVEGDANPFDETWPSNLGSWWLWYNDYWCSSVNYQSGSLVSTALTGKVQNEFFGDKKVSLLLRSPGYRTNYRSREFGTADYRPKLYVYYDP